MIAILVMGFLVCRQKRTCCYNWRIAGRNVGQMLVDEYKTNLRGREREFNPIRFDTQKMFYIQLILFCNQIQ